MMESELRSSILSFWSYCCWLRVWKWWSLRMVSVKSGFWEGGGGGSCDRSGGGGGVGTGLGGLGPRDCGLCSGVRGKRSRGYCDRWTSWARACPDDAEAVPVLCWGSWVGEGSVVRCCSCARCAGLFGLEL